MSGTFFNGNIREKKNTIRLSFNKNAIRLSWITCRGGSKKVLLFEGNLYPQQSHLISVAPAARVKLNSCRIG